MGATCVSLVLDRPVLKVLNDRFWPSSAVVVMARPV
jgi:hypothetical protein